MTQELRSPLQGYRSLHAGRFRVLVKIVEGKVQVVYVAAVGWQESGSRKDVFQRIARAIEAGVVKIPKGERVRRVGGKGSPG